MKTITIPVLSDNYAYLLVDETSGEATVVDPSEAGPVAQAVRREDARLSSIWNTHTHWDHIGGNKGLQKEFGATLYAHGRKAGRPPGKSRALQEGDVLSVGKAKAQVWHVPCHTPDHVVFYFEKEACVFVGDTLFVAGCGRLYDGTPEAMYKNVQRLLSLPNNTKIYCGHEYAQKNLRFALSLEPGNAAAQEKLQEAQDQRRRGGMVMPTTVGDEKRWNPFSRLDSPALRASLAKRYGETPADPVGVFAQVRRWRDQF